MGFYLISATYGSELCPPSSVDLLAGYFSRFSRFSRRAWNSQKLSNASKIAKKSWGLFGGKWEAKTDFCGLGGQIYDPFCTLDPCGFPAFY
jgi:hypothetical protein